MIYLYKVPNKCPVLPDALHMADLLHIGNINLLSVCNIVIAAADTSTGEKKHNVFCLLLVPG